ADVCLLPWYAYHQIPHDMDFHHDPPLPCLHYLNFVSRHLLRPLASTLIPYATLIRSRAHVGAVIELATFIGSDDGQGDRFGRTSDKRSGRTAHDPACFGARERASTGGHELRPGRQGVCDLHVGGRTRPGVADRHVPRE